MDEEDTTTSPRRGSEIGGGLYPGLKPGVIDNWQTSGLPYGIGGTWICRTVTEMRMVGGDGKSIFVTLSKIYNIFTKICVSLCKRYAYEEFMD